MNTHDIELLSTIRDAVQRACNYEVTVLKASEEIQAAIEADRKRRGEHPVLRYMPEILAALKYPNVNVSLVEDIEAALEAPQPADDFEKQRSRIEESMRQGARLTNHRLKLEAPQPAEPSRGVPVAWIRVAEDWSGAPKVVIAKPNQEGAKPVYLAPQPAAPESP